MRPLRSLAPGIALASTIVFVASLAVAQSVDPFGILRETSGAPVPVPPRALAVIPERHTGRAIRLVDELERIEPQFDDLAVGAGLSSRIAIQLRTREANVPIFVAKSDASIATVLALRLGAPIEVTGVVVERGGRYLMLASDVRSAATGSARGR
ncbi:hypothetical protein [Sandaracinus amylolyticus]|uniref:hypothetical protein n=1 Tax=Sandaracinus amylolyticus TaxID=927083 RepID=UPI001F214A4B|nr:hypothetical protein [Sandaracinus amylolyticus]UJR80343.1 Hypothetical protein I5071_23890 [Sandaracinus amylolyticus]